jgi:prepilin-type N-terminal cleavage/methylation domain-containing protein
MTRRQKDKDLPTGDLALQSGFTLIETVMVIVILGVIGLGIMTYFIGIGSSADPVLTTQATGLASEKMERIIADSKANGFNTILAEAVTPLAAPFSRFSTTVEVICVDEVDLDISGGTMPQCNDSDIGAKRVRVIVSWANNTLDLVSIISNH